MVDLVVSRAEGEFVTDVPDTASLVSFDAQGKLGTISALRSYLSTTKPDILFSAHTHANVLALLASLFVPQPPRTIISEHSLVRDRQTYLDYDILDRATAALASILYPHADGLIAVSKEVAHDCMNFFNVPEQDISIIHNPVDIARIQEQAKTPVDHPWFMADAPPVILGVGRLVRRKDFETLLRAFKRLTETREARLVVLGEGECRDALEQLAGRLGIQSLTSFPGWASNPFKFMYQADVIAVSSRSEGFGNVLVEAMACGSSVVSTACPGGPCEILDDGSYGHLVPVGDFKALAQAIEDSIVSPLPEKTLSDRATDFSVQRIADEYEARLFNENDRYFEGAGL